MKKHEKQIHPECLIPKSEYPYITMAHGSGGVYINTTGIGEVNRDIQINPSSIKPGDFIIINGDIGRHGIAVFSQREGLSFETTIESDCAPLSETILKLIDSGVEIHSLRDLTRGGLATALVELANAAGVKIEIDDDSIPVIGAVNAACEILGFDTAYIANEGRFVVFIPERFVNRAGSSNLKPFVVGLSIFFPQGGPDPA